MEIGGKVGTALDSPARIDVNGANSGAAGLAHFHTKVTGNLLQVVIRIRDDAASPTLHREQLVNDVLGLGQMVAADEMVAFPVVRVGLHAEVVADAERRRGRS